MSDPILPFDVWPSQITQASIPANRNALRNEILIAEVISNTVSAQPASPVNGDLYILPNSPTGSQWSTFNLNDLVIYRDGWYAFAPTQGIIKKIDNDLWQYDAGAWVIITSLGADNFTDLLDVPSSYTGQAGKALKVNTLEDGIEFSDAASDFKDLNDVPSSYTGQAGKIPVVKLTEDGLEYMSPGGAVAMTDSIVATFDGGGTAITPSYQCDVFVPYACEITACRLFADITGSIEIDIYADSFSNYPPTLSDSIVASAKPEIVSDIKSEDTTLTGWTTTISAGTILRFNIDSCFGITRATLSLQVTRL